MAKIQALYSRVSTDTQRDKGFAIPRQKRWLADEAKRHRFENPQHYTDNGYSAKDTNRPALKRLLFDIENGKIDTIVVYKYDRIARNLKDLILFLELLDKHNINFISITERFDTTTPIGKAMLNVSGTFAQLERDTTVERVTDAMWDKARKNTFCGGQAPFGYDIRDKKPIINEKEAELIRDIYNEFEERQSLRGVTHWLNTMGYKTKRGETWASATVRRVLTSETYIGRNAYGKRAKDSTVYLPKEKWLYQEGVFEPIISKEQFDRVQAIIRQRFYFPQRRYNIVYILSGIMKCECGGALNGYTQPKKSSGKKYYYYKCHNATSKGKEICPGNTLKKELIEHDVLENVREQAKLHFEEAEAQKIMDKKKKSAPKEHLKRIEAHINRLKAKQRRLLDALEDGSISKDLIVERMDKVALDLEEAENQRQNLKREISPKQKSERIGLLQQINRLNGDFLDLSDETKKGILRQLVKRITVKRTGEVEIELYELE